MTFKRLLVGASVLGLSLVVTDAWSQSEPEKKLSSTEAAVADSVELKNGVYLRGLIVEVDPSSHLSVRLPSGEVRRIPVTEIESAERNGKPLELTAAPSKADSTSAPAEVSPKPVESPVVAAPRERKAETELESILAGIDGPRVKLELTANRTAFLQRRLGDVDDNAVAYHVVCKLPCRVDLPANDLIPYRVGNLRLQSTDWFQVPKYNARVKADLASDMWPVWTRSMLVGGIIAGLVGGSIIGINELSAQSEGPRKTGLVFLGVSGAFFLTSGAFWLFSPSTSYTLDRSQ